MKIKCKLNMLEYSKIVLNKISFDKMLFQKEYAKAVKMLEANDRAQLQRWVRSEWNVLLT